MKRWLLRAAACLLGLVLLGLLVSASGIVPVAASSGHWAITEWFLHFSMRRSIATHSFGITPPPLDDAALVLRGAGHYETGCRSCHGAPGFAPPVIPMAMTPRPADLQRRSADWDAAELFYVVKHGVKMTGMPAWPTQRRDDEVWAMVAFLQRLPELDAVGYRELVFGDGAATPDAAGNSVLGARERGLHAVVQSCARCHGADGAGRGDGAFPVLAGQRPQYLMASLRAYAAGLRHSGIMQPLAAGLTDATMAELARYYAALPAPAPRAEVDAALVARGAELAHDGIPAERVPSCVDCHGPGDAPRRRDYPRLSGQYARYLELQLDLFARGDRGGTDYAELMLEFAHALPEDARRAVAAYYASLAPETGR